MLNIDYVEKLLNSHYRKEKTIGKNVDTVLV